MEQNKNNDISPFHDIDEKDKKLQRLSIGAGMAAVAAGAVLGTSIDSTPQPTQLPKVEVTHLDQTNITPDMLQTAQGELILGNDDNQTRLGDQYKIPTMVHNEAPQTVTESVLHPELANQIPIGAVSTEASVVDGKE